MVETSTQETSQTDPVLKDETAETLHENAVEDLATFTEDFQIHIQPFPSHQRQGGYTHPQVGQAVYYNMPGAESSPRRVPRLSPYASTPDVNGGYYGPYSTAGHPRGQHPAGYPPAQPFGAGNPTDYYQAQSHRIAHLPATYGSEAPRPGAYEQEARHSARHAQNANPFFPRPYPSTHPRHDSFAQDSRFYSQEDRLRRRMLQDGPNNVSDHPRNSSPSYEVSQHPAPPAPPSGVYLQPHMTSNRPDGRYQQSSTGWRDMKLSKKPLEARKATRRDAQRLKISDGYILQHWNPDEKPIYLVGTVFDYYSLGKWIFDWTGHICGSPSPMAEIAGDLWCVLIKFYGGIKESEEFVERNRGTRNRGLHEFLGLLSWFIDDATILEEDLDELLRNCEKAMLKTASGNTGRLGKKAGQAFVDTFFGRDQLLEETEVLQQNFRNWFDQWNEECAQSDWMRYPPGGFHHTGHTYQGPSQGGYAPVRTPPMSQPFQQPLRCFPRRPSWAAEWHEIYPPSGYKRGHVEYQASSAFNGPEKPHRHRNHYRATGPTQYGTDAISSSNDDADSGHHRHYSQESRNTDSPVTRPHKKRDATPEDAAKYNIPTYYDLQNWDPDEQPILLCGAVYDPDSGGKWIYGWAFKAHGPSATEAEKSGELWLSMANVAGKLIESTTFVSQCVRAESLEQAEDKEMVEDFIDSGIRLMERLQKVVGDCEKVMFDPDKKNTGQLRDDHGIAFVHALFSSDTHFEQTDRLMQGMRLWISRWERNCEEIIKAGPGKERPVDDGVDGDQNSDN